MKWFRLRSGERGFDDCPGRKRLAIMGETFHQTIEHRSDAWHGAQIFVRYDPCVERVDALILQDMHQI